MSTKRQIITKNLSDKTEKLINPHKDVRVYTSKEVTFDYSTNYSIRVDYMKFIPKNNSISGIEKGDFYCYEIKSCEDDFNSEHGHNFIGDYNYYVMPSSLYNKISSKILGYVGVYIEDEYGDLISIKKARRINRTKATSEMLLMMFRSSNRELMKLQKKETYNNEE